MGTRSGLVVLLCLTLVGCLAKAPPQTELQELIIAGAEGQRVDPAWEVASVEYLFTWGGMGDGVFDWQKISCAAEACEQNAATPVEPQAVQQLIEALAHFHPTQSSLAGILMYDNYPAWQIEVTGQDRQQTCSIRLATGIPTRPPGTCFMRGACMPSTMAACGRPWMPCLPAPQENQGP